MIEINQKYGSKGLVFIGISLDQDRGAMLQVTKQQGMTWPEYFDGQVWKNALFQKYGGNSIPFTMLIGTNGKVRFAGHPEEGLEQAIEKAFKEDPPQLVDPKVLASTKASLDQIDKQIDAGDAKSAIRALSKLPAAAKVDPEFANHSAEVQKKLETSADTMLGEAQSQIDAGKYSEAAARLKELTDALTGLPAASKAKKMLGEMMAKPEARAALAQAEKNAKADEALAVALKLQSDKKDEQAYGRFKDIAHEYAGTSAGDKAQAQLQKYEANPTFVRQANEHAAAGKAKSALHMAESYRQAGRVDLARKKYQSIINEFPGTSYAEAAQKALGELPES